VLDERERKAAMVKGKRGPKGPKNHVKLAKPVMEKLNRELGESVPKTWLVKLW